MLKLASEGMIVPYKVIHEHGFVIKNVFGFDTKEGFILAYVDGATTRTPEGTRFVLNSLKPERIYCKFRIVNPATGEEVK